MDVVRPAVTDRVSGRGRRRTRGGEKRGQLGGAQLSALSNPSAAQVHAEGVFQTSAPSVHALAVTARRVGHALFPAATTAVGAARPRSGPPVQPLGLHAVTARRSQGCVVVCAMPLQRGTRETLQAQLGCVVVDICEAPEDASIVLAPELSLRAATILLEMFPRARVVTCRFLDDEHPTDIPASILKSSAMTSLSGA